MNNNSNTSAKKVLPIRFIDIGEVSYLRSQSIYHGLAYAKKDGDPDIIIINKPKEPYVCVGFHGNVNKEVDLDYCKANQLPIIKRETGGGTVYLDADQLFVQWVFSDENLPRRNDRRFDLFINPMIETYKFFNINAYAFPPNDVHVNGKKIVGTGAATIGDAEVMTGNFILDFDCDIMSKVLKVPSEDFREMILESLNNFMTSVNKEIGSSPELHEIISVYIGQCELFLDRFIVLDSISDREWEEINKIDKKLSSDLWTYDDDISISTDRLVKIHGDVWIFESFNTTESGKTFLLTIRTKGKRINQLSIKGEVDFSPPHKLKSFEVYLRNVEINEYALHEAIAAFYLLHDIKTPGIEIKDWVNCILKIKSQNALTPFN